MISFIVIGKNEGKYLHRCISSIENTILVNKLNQSEIIYVDSDSSDNSINIVKSFENVNIYKISGNTNAALARNIGAEKSKGDILIFMDGDMELIAENLIHFFHNKDSLKNDYVTGDFINLFYENDILVAEKINYNYKKDSYRSSMGGLFLINKVLWNKNGGMRTFFRRSQDIDFALRISKYKKILQKTIPLALHHTVNYNNLKRFNKDFFSGNFFYRTLLIKYNIFNKYILKRIFKESTSIVLFFALLSMVLEKEPMYLFLYLSSILIRIIFKNRLNSFLRYIYVYLVVDICNLFSFFFFWPRNIKKEEYKVTKILRNS